MKKLFFLLFITLTILSCSSPKDKAQKLIEKNLKETLDDPTSYESVNFSDLDSVFTTPYETNSEYRKYFDLWCENESEFRIDPDSTISMRSNEELVISKKIAKECDLKMDSIRKKFKKEFIGWEMKHSYRLKNELGQKKIYFFSFHLDKDFTTIMSKEEIQIK
jgi:hypothetical protein